MTRNLLSAETSPYLLQHQDNPVHWRPWNPAALAEAVAAGKPILLSIGYAACHWCHVMAHESFEDTATAALINDLFIPIKVDREERPDLDAIYQGALALLGQPGGWPLTMFLTPGAEPFWGGTYFPARPGYGRPAFAEVLRAVADAYRASPADIDSNVRALLGGLKESTAGPRTTPVPDLDRTAEMAARAIDAVHGGLAGAPKFPHVPLLSLIWRAALRRADPSLAEAVTLSLDHMCKGGIYDQIGGGFARYATDEAWLVPHFEKMLYDNAQMIELLTLVWQTTRSPLYARAVAETIGWVLRDMPTEGAFAATLDADSEGEEGRYYVWRRAEVDAALGPKAEAFARAHDVRPEGNWENGRSILQRNHADGAGDGDFAAERATLLALRADRVPPGRDDKILADWNGMMIAALAQAGFVFDRTDWIAAAATAFDAVRARLDAPEGRLGHAWRAGRRLEVAMLDDYAQMARAALLLGEVTGEQRYVDDAVAWVGIVDAHYRDDAGGYFFTADDARDLIVRTKTAFDAATPSGNGVMMEVLSRLYHLTGAEVYRRRAEDLWSAFASQLDRSVIGMATLLNGWDHLTQAVQVTMVVPDGADATTLRRVVAETPLPTRVLSWVDSGHSLPSTHPAFGKTAPADRAAAYVCRGPVCQAPAFDPATLRERLRPA